MKNSVLDILQELKLKKNLLSRKTIFCLDSFLNGWYYRNPHDVIGANIFNELQSYAEIEFNYGVKGSRSWVHYFWIRSEDEFYALEYLYEVLERQSYSERKENSKSSTKEVVNNSLIKLLEIIGDRTPMYVGYDSIYNLKAFIDGWVYKAPDEVEGQEVFLRFIDHISKNRKVGNLDFDGRWDVMLLSYTFNESKALDKFFKLWNEFISESIHGSPDASSL